MMPNSGIKFISSEGVFLASFVVISFIAMDVVVGVVEVLFEVPGLFVEVIVDVVAIVFDSSNYSVIKPNTQVVKVVEFVGIKSMMPSSKGMKV